MPANGQAFSVLQKSEREKTNTETESGIQRNIRALTAACEGVVVGKLKQSRTTHAALLKSIWSLEGSHHLVLLEG